MEFIISPELYKHNSNVLVFLLTFSMYLIYASLAWYDLKWLRLPLLLQIPLLLISLILGISLSSFSPVHSALVALSFFLLSNFTVKRSFSFTPVPLIARGDVILLVSVSLCRSPFHFFLIIWLASFLALFYKFLIAPLQNLIIPSAQDNISVNSTSALIPFGFYIALSVFITDFFWSEISDISSFTQSISPVIRLC